MLSLKFFVYSKKHIAHSENAASDRLQQVKHNGKTSTVRPEKVVAIIPLFPCLLCNRVWGLGPLFVFCGNIWRLCKLVLVRGKFHTSSPHIGGSNAIARGKVTFPLTPPPHFSRTRTSREPARDSVYSV